MSTYSTSDKKIILIDENFSYGYDNDLYNLRSANSQFKCYYQRAEYIPYSFREECLRVCKKISDRAVSLNRIPYVLLSGGADSEVVLRAFLELGVPFKVITHRFTRDLNSHEIAVVDKLSKELNFDITYIDIDVVNWLNSPESLNMAEQSKCFQAEMLPTMKLLDYVYFELNGIPVLGNGDFYANRLDGIWKYVEYEYILSWFRYVIARKMIAAVNFFQVTPEIVLSIGLDPIMSELFRSAQDETINSRYAKYKIYQKYWGVQIREKYHGCELIQNECDQIQQKFLTAYESYTDKWKMPVNKFLKNLMPNEF
jgi:hypothetical protein